MPIVYRVPLKELRDNSRFQFISQSFITNIRARTKTFYFLAFDDVYLCPGMLPDKLVLWMTPILHDIREISGLSIKGYFSNFNYR